ncbi:tannase [bacterium]|nr:tannase [bacterium]
MKKIIYLFILFVFFRAEAANLKIDNTKWLYNAEDNVYYQLQIPYCNKPLDEKFEKLAIFVPEKFMQCSKNNNNTYSCKVNKNAKIKNYTPKTAPIVFPVETEGYSSNLPLEEYQSFKKYTDNGIIYIVAGARGKEHSAPNGVADLKAAIRFIKYNKKSICANTDKIILSGMSGGGAQAAILAAGGNSSFFKPYLQKIGALKKRDDVYGVSVWCPITNLDSANAAYEWNMGVSREDLSEEEQKVSQNLAREFAFYVNQKKFKDENGKRLVISRSPNGEYKEGSYVDYIKNQIENSLNNFLVDTEFPYTMENLENPIVQTRRKYILVKNYRRKYKKPIFKKITIKEILQKTLTFDAPKDYIDYLNQKNEWVTYDEEKNSVKITNIDEFSKNLKKAQKPIGAFDAFDKSTPENLLFGLNSNPSHFDKMSQRVLYHTQYGKEFEKDLSQKDEFNNSIQTRLMMYTPLYYLMDSYKEGKKSTLAKHWRIRSGINQSDTSLTTEVNLALALKNNKKIKTVDFETVWNKAHVRAERKGDWEDNFIDWILSLRD